MKKETLIAKLFVAMLCSSFLLSGCSDFISEMSSDTDSVVQKFGSICIGYDDVKRAAAVSSIKTAKIVVSGDGIKSGSEPSTTASVENGKVQSCVVNNIPYGKNRIVTVYAYNGEAENSKLISEIKLRAVCDIDGTNIPVVIDSTTTALGNAFNKLFEDGVKVSLVEKESVNEKIKSGTHYALIDSERIAADYENKTLENHTADDYVVSAGSVKFDYYFADGYTVQVDDPLSAPETNVSAGPGTVLENVAPGKWTLKLLKNGEVIEKYTVTVEAGSQKVMGVLPCTDKVAVVYSRNSNGSGKVYAWAGDSNQLTKAYPGDDAETIGDYYVWTYSAKDSFNVKVDGLTSDVALVSGYGVYVLKNGLSGDLTKENEFVSEDPFEGETEIEVSRSGSKILLTVNCDVISSEVKVKSGSNEVKAVFEGRTAVVNLSSWNLSKGDVITVSGSVTGTYGTADVNKSFTFNDEDSIIVHAKYKYVYYWTSTVTGTHNEMENEGNSIWYSFTIPLTSVNLIFEQNANWSGKTVDLSITGAGEYWYKDGNWYNSNPDDAVAPVLVSFTSSNQGTVTGNVTFTVKAADNKELGKAFILCDGNVSGTVVLSGTEGTGTFILDTTVIKNGTHEIVCYVKDAAGNISESKKISITTNNENLPPVAVISGSKRVQCNKTIKYSASKSYDQNEGSVVSYKWTVTGSGASVVSGLTGTELTVKTAASEGLNFTVTLVVKDDLGAFSSTVSLDAVTQAVDPDWDFRDETIYFLMTTRFYDGDTGNNLYCWDEGGDYLKYGAGDCAWRGDFKGLIDKLDYIKALGFSTIWITPVVVNASGIDYHGYHAYDFSHVDPRYASGSAVYDANGDDISGDLAYQELINAVHDRGMKIMQDIVLNHTGNWGEKNLNHLFDKGEAYVDANGYKRAAPMVANENSSVLRAAEAKLNYSSYEEAKAVKNEYQVRLKALKDDDVDPQLYHHEEQCEYKDITYVMGSMAGDCVDLNTENPTVQDYLIECYKKYIDMGVDSFRIDTVKHITRGVFNKVFNPAFHAAAAANGNDKFYMTGEVCARWNGRWSDNNIAQGTPSFYTWKDSTEDSYNRTLESNWTTAAHNAKTSYPYVFWDAHANEKWTSILDAIKPSVCNARLNGNEYHTPDYTNFSGLNTIDFKMHWQFKEAYNAFQAAKDYDEDICDASWQVTYVDSHDYAPDQAPQDNRFDGYWPDKLNLIFTFRGIPCIYYGSEVEFMKGFPIDPANARCSLKESGRAYFGDFLEGDVDVSDFGVYSNASGTMATTLNHDLAQHIRRLNLIRRAIPALRKGQYSTEGCSGSIAFKRRYTKNGVDSFVLVAIGGQASFTGVPSGSYVEVITGKTVSCNGSLTTDSIGQDNMRVYVLQTGDGVEPTGQIGEAGAYLK